MTGLALGPAALLGKLPALAEYVRAGARGAELDGFEAWVSVSMDRLLAQPRETWLDRYRAGSTFGFVFAAGTGAPIAGALRPSFDALGRTFPLVVAARLSCGPEVARSPEVLPILLEPLWLRAARHLTDLRAVDRAALESCVVDLAAIEVPDFDMAESTLSSWTSSLAAPALWALLYEEPSSATDAVRLCLECIRPVIGLERPSTPLTLRLPLGRAGGAAVCFWLALVRRAAGRRATVPSFFWSHDGEKGALLLHLGTPPPATLEELWASRGRHDEFCDLVRLPSEGELKGVPPLPPAIRSACTDWSLTVRELLGRIGLLAGSSGCLE